MASSAGVEIEYRKVTDHSPIPLINTATERIAKLSQEKATTGATSRRLQFTWHYSLFNPNRRADTSLANSN
jgi:hypothetical protein